jgi:peptide-methionine (R)-S-oxide reductase
MDKQMPTEEELKNKLTDEEYHVLREKGTEAPFSGKLYNEKRSGKYSCKVCGTPLFASDTKFESNLPGLMGWPAFDQALPGAVLYKEDNSLGMHRTEVLCATCGSHLGHIFDDKGASSGKHYCVNSVCLDFEEKDANSS